MYLDLFWGTLEMTNRAVLNASKFSRLLQKVYPKQLAGSWDNTGLLLESPFTRATSTSLKILLCIDLTTSVCEEALRTEGCAHIVTYHPIIFSGLKSLTLANSQQRSLLRLSAAGISVYSPHTSVDAVMGGVNDMLVDCFKVHSTIEKSACVEKCTTSVAGFEDAGAGRLVTLTKPISVEDAVAAIKKGLGLEFVQLARAKSCGAEGMIRTIAICAGSGGSVLRNCEVDLVFTGELSHHEQLAFLARGSHIILCGHANTERPFLPTMKQQIQELLATEDSVEVFISEADKNPYETV